jgi:hypothetical protein
MPSWARQHYGTGTIFKRGRIWYLSYYVNGQQVVRSSRSTNIQDAKRLRDQILGKKSRGELDDAVTVNVTCGELPDDLSNTRPTSKLRRKKSGASWWKPISGRSLGTARAQT